MFAFLPTLGFTEMVILLGIGLLLYGRNLPEVGRSLGRTVAQLKRGMAEFKSQMDADGSLRDAKRALQDTVQDVRRAAEQPTAMIDQVRREPERMLRDLTNEALSSADPAPEPSAPPAVDPNGTAGPPAG
ncbi:MAG: twin-arginine translocase TatA/TatE family subunit [Planctomycetes bacterium]|nr:twin-arginine translocase TatA/TatE family subunit [Planctomycetota bacterium]